MMYRVKRKRIKTKERIMVAGETFRIEELGIKPGPKLDRLIDRLTRLDQITEIETIEDKPVVKNITVVNNIEAVEPPNSAVVLPETDNNVTGTLAGELTLEDLEHKGPWYYFPNGEKVRGKEKAIEALAALSG